MVKTLELPNSIDDCHKLIVDLARSSEEKNTTIEKLQFEIKELKKIIKLANHKLYGSSSEKSKYFDEYLDQKFKYYQETNIDIQLDLFNDVEMEFREFLESQETNKVKPEDDEEASPKKKRKDKYNKRLTENPSLPVEECHHNVNHNFCVKCKEEDYRELPPEKTRQIEIIPAKVFIKEHVTHKSICGCGVIRRGDKPLPPLNKCSASASLLAHIAYSRFDLYLPYYRLVKDFRSLGLEVSDVNLCNWMSNLSTDLFLPLYKEIKKSTLDTDTLLCDETTIREQAKVKCKQMYIWAYTNSISKTVVFDYSNRSRENPNDFLRDYRGMYLLTDKYSGYNEICKRNKIKRCFCWAHARRKFYEIIKSSSDPNELALIKEVYKLITKMLKKDRRLRKSVSRANLVASRKDTIEPLIDQIFDKLDEIKRLSVLMVAGSIENAVNYTLASQDEFKNFLDHPDLEPTNNESERNVRFVTIGRKNWLFTGSAKGGKTLAIIATIISSAKMNGLNVREYLEDIIKRLPETKISELPSLMPQNYKKACQ